MQRDVNPHYYYLRGSSSLDEPIIQFNRPSILSFSLVSRSLFLSSSRHSDLNSLWFLSRVGDFITPSRAENRSGSWCHDSSNGRTERPDVIRWSLTCDTVNSPRWNCDQLLVSGARQDQDEYKSRGYSALLAAPSATVIIARANKRAIIKNGCHSPCQHPRPHRQQSF